MIEVSESGVRLTPIGQQRYSALLGVSPAGISTLHTLPPQANAPSSTGVPLPLFAQLLQRQQRTGNASTEPSDAR